MVLLWQCDYETDKQFNSMCDIFSEALHTNFVFPTGNLSFLIRQTKKTLSST